MEALTPRQLCNLAYYLIVEDITASYRAAQAAGAQFESEDPLGDQIQKFEETVGLRYDSTDFILEQHKLFLKAQGKEWDDTPVYADDTSENAWWNQNVEYTTMADLNRRMTKKV